MSFITPFGMVCTLHFLQCTYIAMHDYFMIHPTPCMYIAIYVAIAIAIAGCIKQSYSYIGTMLLYTYLYTQRSEETKRKQSEQRRLQRKRS